MGALARLLERHPASAMLGAWLLGSALAFVCAGTPGRRRRSWDRVRGAAIRLRDTVARWRNGREDPLAADREAAIAWCGYRNRRAASEYEAYETTVARHGAWTQQAADAKARYLAARDDAWRTWEGWALIERMTGPVRCRPSARTYLRLTYAIPGTHALAREAPSPPVRFICPLSAASHRDPGEEG